MGLRHLADHDSMKVKSLLIISQKKKKKNVKNDENFCNQFLFGISKNFLAKINSDAALTEKLKF